MLLLSCAKFPAHPVIKRHCYSFVHTYLLVIYGFKRFSPTVWKFEDWFSHVHDVVSKSCQYQIINIVQCSCSISIDKQNPTILKIRWRRMFINDLGRVKQLLSWQALEWDKVIFIKGLSHIYEWMIQERAKVKGLKLKWLG